MVTLKLAAGMAIGAATSALLAYAGTVTGRRPVAPAEHLALRAFAAWWYGASVVILLPTLRTVLAVVGIVDPALHATIALLGNVPLALALGGLAYYILYLITGRSRWMYPVAIAYSAYFGYLLWYTNQLGERTVAMGEWQARLVAENAAPPAATLVFGLVLAGPILALVLAYSVLVFRVQQRTQRYRLIMVAGGFLQLFVAVLAGFALQLTQEPWFPLMYELPALMLSILVVTAYRPPRLVQRWLKIEAVPALPPTQPTSLSSDR